MGLVLTEGKHTGEHVVWEVNPQYSRDTVTIDATSSALVAGTVLGKVTATGEYLAYSNAASNGTEVAVAVLMHAVPDATVDQKAVASTRQTIVAASRLTGLDAAARADLAAVGILVRD